MGDGYQEVVFPITKEMRDMINNMAVSAYKLAMTEMTKKMEQTQAAGPAAPAPASPEMEMQ
jgi:DNA-binding cell septation regulator SpoVG